MARPALSWPDAQMRLITTGIARANRDFPLDNERFLDEVIDEVRTITGRLYGARTYARLIGTVPEAEAVDRRPSLTTIQKAVDRAQALGSSSIAAGSDGATGFPLDVHTLRRVVEPSVREALAPLQSLLARVLAQRPAPGAVVTMPSGDQQLRWEIEQASREDALAQLQRLQDENAQPRRELAGAEVRFAVAETSITALLESIQRAIADSGSGADALAAAARRLEKTEQFLKAQNDAVRLQATAEAESLRRQVDELRKRIDHLLLDNDQYRRALLRGRNHEAEGAAPAMTGGTRQGT